MAATAIPWLFDGIPFRSKLEAKWYEVFRLLGLRPEHEPMGFEIKSVYDDDSADFSDRDTYLPDFAIHHRDGLHYVEIKPWLEDLSEDYSLHHLMSIRNAVILGYTQPTMILCGSPSKFFGVICNERCKGNPAGSAVCQRLLPLGYWRPCDWYPDEDWTCTDPRSWELSGCYGMPIHVFWRCSPFAELAEQNIQWHGKRSAV